MDLPNDGKKLAKIARLPLSLMTVTINGFRIIGYSTKRIRRTIYSVTHLFYWSGRPGSNRRRPAWEAGILLLDHARSPCRGQGRLGGKGPRPRPTLPRGDR